MRIHQSLPYFGEWPSFHNCITIGTVIKMFLEIWPIHVAVSTIEWQMFTLMSTWRWRSLWWKLFKEKIIYLLLPVSFWNIETIYRVVQISLHCVPVVPGYASASASETFLFLLNVCHRILLMMRFFVSFSKTSDHLQCVTGSLPLSSLLNISAVECFIF